MIQQQRRLSSAAIFFAAAVLLLTIGFGCGGGGQTRQFVDTGSPAGSLAGVQILPSPNDAYVRRGTVFRLSWTHDSPPPPNYEVELQRYREAHECNDAEDAAEDQEQETDGVGTRLVRQGDTFVWDLEPDGDLEGGGVYFVHLTAGPDQVRRVFVANDDRSVEAAGARRKQGAGAGGAVKIRHTVIVP